MQSCSNQYFLATLAFIVWGAFLLYICIELICLKYSSGTSFRNLSPSVTKASRLESVFFFFNYKESCQVAERALFLWNNEHLVELIANNRNVILPIIFESLEKNKQTHWNPAIHGLTGNVQRMFLEMDADLYEECQRQLEEKEARADKLEEERQLMWKKLEDIVAQSGGADMVLVN